VPSDAVFSYAELDLVNVLDIGDIHFKLVRYVVDREPVPQCNSFCLREAGICLH
jgi:hypothetical protein